MRDETIASSRHVRDVSHAILAIAQRFAKARDRHPETAVAHHHVRPGSNHQLALSNDFTGGFDKCDEDIERSTADVDSLPAFQQYALRRDQAVRSRTRQTRWQS